jgi:hypothetical protein
VTQAAASTRVRPALLPYLFASASLCTVAVASATYAFDSAALHGAASAALAAFFALPALAVGASHGNNGVLAGFVAGFFARMIAVAVGLVLTGARAGAALTFAAWFFGLYIATQAVEVAYVWSSSRLSRRAGA